MPDNLRKLETVAGGGKHETTQQDDPPTCTEKEEDTRIHWGKGGILYVWD